MRKPIGLALALTLAAAAAAQAAPGANVQGAAALALAALAAEHEASLPLAQRQAVAALFDGGRVDFPKSRTIVVKVDKIVCRVSDVAINQRSCLLTFGSRTVNLAGRRANELDATLAAAGVPPDGAAGSSFEGLSALNCTLDPSEIAQNTGGGANCAFVPGP
jgi:hypothetical protein